jgi:hypothetical protein
MSRHQLAPLYRAVYLLLMQNTNLKETPQAREINAWLLQHDPDALCCTVGYPDPGRQVCILTPGHSGYHESASGVRWLGYRRG